MKISGKSKSSLPPPLNTPPSGLKLKNDNLFNKKIIINDSSNK